MTATLRPVLGSGTCPASCGRTAALELSLSVRAIAVTAMRLSEAIELERTDGDLEEGVLAVRESEFGKSRLAPLHPATHSCAERRDAHLGSRCGAYFFVAERRRPGHEAE